MIRVLVTRPEPGAAATARRLQELGYEPVLLPLTRIEPLAVDPLPDPASCDAVLATSANAIRNAPVELLRRLAAKPLLVVGERTAESARDAGFATIDAVADDAAALVYLIEARVARGTRFLYLAGAERGHVLEDGLQRLGHPVETVAIYDAPEIRYPADVLSRTLGPSPLDVALVYSSRAARLLARLATRAEITPLFERTLFLTISEQTSGALAPVGAGRTLAAAQPTEDALFALLPQG